MFFRIKQMLLCCVVVVLFVTLMELVERSSACYKLDYYPQTHLMRYPAGAVIHWGREGYGTTTIGPEGMIVNKSLGAGARVLFLGDSFTEALQVDDADKFTELTQELYNRQLPAKPINTLNFAFSGQSAVQYAADLPGLSRYWQPQIVVVQLSSFDFDKSDVTLRTNNQTARLATQPNGQFTIENALPPTVSRKQRGMRILANARLFSTVARVSWRVNQFLNNTASSETAATTPSAAPVVAQTGPEANAQETAYRERVQWLLQQLRETCQAQGARLVVLYTPRAPQFQQNRIWYDESWPRRIAPESL